MTFKKNGLGEYVAYNKDWYKYVNETGKSMSDQWENRPHNYETWDDCPSYVFGHIWARVDAPRFEEISDAIDASPHEEGKNGS